MASASSAARSELFRLIRLISIFCAALALGVFGMASGLASADQTPAGAPAAQGALQPRALGVQGNAHCRCEITCTGGGKSFNRANSPFPGFTQGLESERNRCRGECENWVGNNIANWASEEGVCGELTCSGTSHVGDEPGSKWKNVNPQTTNRQCCPGGGAASGEGCPLKDIADLASVFQLVPNGSLGGAYDLLYQRNLNIGYDQTFQAFTTYLASPGVRPNLHHLGVAYQLFEETSPGTWTTRGWRAVNYYPNSTAGGNPPTYFLNNTPPTYKLGVNINYRLRRYYYFKDAQDKDIAYGNDSCKLIELAFRITLTQFKAASGAPARSGAVAKIEGQPDRTIPIRELTPIDRRQLQAVSGIDADQGRQPQPPPDVRQ
jgi:hypothetical protein